MLDNLLVMGLLTDDDMHQLLFLIDPETFDEGCSKGKYLPLSSIGVDLYLLNADLVTKV